MKVNVLRRGSEPGKVILTRPIEVVHEQPHHGVVFLEETGIEQQAQQVANTYRRLLAPEEFEIFKESLARLAQLPINPLS